MIQAMFLDDKKHSMDGFCKMVFLLFFIALFQSAALHAQNGGNSRIDRLFGGNIGVNMKWSGSGFSGLGARPEAMGGSITTLFSDAQSVSSNPAGLGFARGFSMVFDWSPGMTINPDGISKAIGLGSLEDRINTSLNETVRNNSSGGVVQPGAVQNASVHNNLDMNGGLKGAALMYGNPIFALAFSFHQPLQLDLQLNMSGVEFLAAALDNSGKETQRIFGIVNGNLNMVLVMRSSTIAAGTRLHPKLAVGLAYDNFNSSINIDGTFLPEGVIASASGDTRSFNDPARVQYDSLYTTIGGNLEGDDFRLRGGAGYHPTHNISIDATFSMPVDIQLSGSFAMIYNNIAALDLGADDNEEVFDVDKLVEDNLTKTEKQAFGLQNLNLKTPGNIAVGFSARWDNYLASLVYTKYFSALGYGLNYEKRDSLNVVTDAGSITQGVNFKSAIRLGIGVKPMMLGLGFISGKTFSQKIIAGESKPEVDDKGNLFLPMLSLGGSIKLTSHFQFDYVASLYNSSFFRFSTTYRL